ncbi:hypothetical protein [Pseudomonas sp. NUPR-001]|uniref:hypothetical protein n=1 Tax=Pseudomonas sp. NUPR-001 TaxID=3416058 RepID=UPI003F953229
MVGITAVSNIGAAANSATLGTVSINGGLQNPAVPAEGEAGTSPLSFSGIQDGKKAQSSAASESSESSEPAHIQQLRKMIEKLKKQLAEQQKQLQSIMTSKMEATAKATAVAAAQSAVSTTMGALMTATAQLAEALLKGGGGGAGSMVSTSA